MYKKNYKLEIWLAFMQVLGGLAEYVKLCKVM